MPSFLLFFMSDEIKNNRDKWKAGFRNLARVVNTGSFWKIENLRDFSYPEGVEDKPEERWADFTFSLHDVAEAFLYTVPFFARGVAHVMVGFKIKERIIIASPELSCLVGQTFSFRTFLGTNRLQYVWGTAEDLIHVRQNVGTSEPVFTTPLRLSRKQRIQLFKSLAKRTNVVNHSRVEKYHVLLNNCSRHVIHHLEQIGFSFRTIQKIFYILFPANVADWAGNFTEKQRGRLLSRI